MVQMWNQWHVVHPAVFRCLPKAYVDAFFADGSLRLSSFKQFQKHKDEQRHDHEGMAILEGFSPKQGKEVFIVAQAGVNMFVLCATTWLSRELLKQFDCDAAFEIFDTTNFAHEVGRQLAGWIGGFEGHCIYQDGAIIRRQHEWFFEKFEAAQQRKDQITFDDLARMSSEIGGYHHFLVKMPKFAHQAEYRLLWALDGRTPDYIDIKCPRARQYCRPVEVNSLY